MDGEFGNGGLRASSNPPYGLFLISSGVLGEANSQIESALVDTGRTPSDAFDDFVEDGDLPGFVDPSPDFPQRDD